MITAAPHRPTAVRVNGGEPQRGLLPSDTNEGYGNRIVDLLFSGLYDYACDGTTRAAMLERVDSEDSREFRFVIQPGWTFTDGTPVSAGNFVAAWNFGAAGGNAQRQQSWYRPIEGFAEVAGAARASATMSGLVVEDDRTFAVRLSEPNRDFLNGLGFTPFKPLPDRFFTVGPAEFGEHPVGNGPYQLAGDGAWQHDVRLELVPNPRYPGPDRPSNDGITFVFYRDLELAYQDLLDGRLEVLDCVPDCALSRYRAELGRRAIEQPVALNKSLGVPYSLDRFAGDEGRLRRSAISMAIDRPEIISQVFAGTKVPATGFAARTLPGFDRNLAGADVLSYQPDRAHELWRRANEIHPWQGSFTIAFNTDGGHQSWITMVTEQVSRVLGIEAAGYPLATFKQLREHLTSGARTAFRTGWRGDYPSLIGSLEPLFAGGASANDVGYYSPAFEQALAQARRAGDEAAANRWVEQAQLILLADLPVIPLWDFINAGGLGHGVQARFKWNGLPDYQTIRCDAGAGAGAGHDRS